MALQFKNYFNFSRGEWSAIILLLLLILFSFLIYYLYEEQTDSNFDLIGYQNEIHNFENYLSGKEKNLIQVLLPLTDLLYWRKK